ncbi:MAG: hypothetical protein PHP22_12865, partial [Oscillospiraceae bacterium]|nr:hypothetical protein [Oscillospiraceae bacterium]
NTKVIVEYQSPDGQIIRAGTNNPPSYTIGEQYIGKVVEDNPYLVYREVQEWKDGKLIFLIGFVVFYLLNLLFLIILLRRIRANKLLASKGQITEAEMVGFVPAGDDIFVEVRFKDEKGFIHCESCRPLPYMDLNAKTCFVRYIITSKNKADCEIFSEKDN